MKSLSVIVLTTLVGVSATPPACAAEPVAGSWDIQAGPASINFHEKIILSASGTPIHRGWGLAQDNRTLAAEFTYHFTPSWSAAVMTMVPPRSAISGRGEARPLGTLGAVHYMPISLIGKYQLDTDSNWHPYVGVGGVYFAVVKASDGSVRDFKVDNKLGAALQAGVQYDFNPSLGVFVDLKKFYVKTTANGNVPALGGVPVRLDMTLDPAVFQVGIVLRF